MELNILKDSKDEIEVELENITLAEILRVYLNKDSSVALAVWKQNHPTKKPVLLVKAKGKTGRKAIKDAVSLISKDLKKLDKEFSGLK
jgi:DNA-directed RNA polymerase subunit L